MKSSRLTIMCLLILAVSIGCKGKTKPVAKQPEMPVVPKEINSATVATPSQANKYLIEAVVNSTDKRLRSVQRLLQEQKRSSFTILVDKHESLENSISAMIHFEVAVTMKLKDGEIAVSNDTSSEPSDERLWIYNKKGEPYTDSDAVTAMKSDAELFPNWNNTGNNKDGFTVFYGQDPVALKALASQLSKVEIAELSELQPLLPYLLEWPPMVPIESFLVDESGSIKIGGKSISVTLEKGAGGTWSLESFEFTN